MMAQNQNSNTLIADAKKKVVEKPRQVGTAEPFFT